MERTFILASAVGTMRRQLEQSVFHATNHRRFGSPIGTNQAVAHRVADMAVTVEAARLMLYHAAWLKDTRRRAPAASSATKLFLSNAFLDVSQSAFDVHGGYAYMSGTDQERDLRDALASRIYSGTSDIQRNIIARTLGL